MCRNGRETNENERRIRGGGKGVETEEKMRKERKAAEADEKTGEVGVEENIVRKGRHRGKRTENEQEN